MTNVPDGTCSATALRKYLIDRIKRANIVSEYMDLDIKDLSYTKGIAFFPYGNGLLEYDNDIIPAGCIMIVGQDFGTKEYVDNKSFIEKGERDKPTMRIFLQLLGDTNHDFFFTNLFMGLRVDKSMIGKNPALKSNKEKIYTDFCYGFLEYQVSLVKPRLIVVLGKVPFEFLCQWQNTPSPSFKTFTNYFANPSKELFKNVPMICLPHPSMWNSNLKENKDAMVKLFKERCYS